MTYICMMCLCVCKCVSYVYYMIYISICIHIHMCTYIYVYHASDDIHFQMKWWYMIYISKWKCIMHLMIYISKWNTKPLKNAKPACCLFLRALQLLRSVCFIHVYIIHKISAIMCIYTCLNIWYLCDVICNSTITHETSDES